MARQTGINGMEWDDHNQRCDVVRNRSVTYHARLNLLNLGCTELLLERCKERCWYLFVRREPWCRNGCTPRNSDATDVHVQ